MVTLGRKSDIARRPFFIGVFALLTALGIYFLVLPYRTAGSGQLAVYPDFPPLHTGDRITIVSPHLDDESIGLGGFIAEARRRGIPVSVVFMTNGDDYPLAADLQFHTGYPTPTQLIQFGVDRQGEATAALATLGVDRSQLYFLGLPDRGLAAMRQPAHLNTPYTSPATLRNASPYPDTYIPNLTYTGTAATAALTQAVVATRPDYIFTTLPDDRHTDHAATAAYVQQILPNLPTHPHPYYFLVHYPGYPFPKGVNSHSPLLPPTNLRARSWRVIFLDAAAESAKQQAIQKYGTQLRVPISGRLLRAFVRTNELVQDGL